MIINDKKIQSETEIIQLIKQGVNVLEYFENDTDIELIAKAITHEEDTSDVFFNDMTEILLKTIIYSVVLNKGEKDKSLKRCKEILDNVIKSSDIQNEMEKITSGNDVSKILYNSISIAPPKTYHMFFVLLQERLNKILG